MLWTDNERGDAGYARPIAVYCRPGIAMRGGRNCNPLMSSNDLAGRPVSITLPFELTF